MNEHYEVVIGDSGWYIIRDTRDKTERWIAVDDPIEVEP